MFRPLSPADAFPATDTPPPLAPAVKPATPGELWDASGTMALATRSDADTRRLHRDFEPIIDALGLAEDQNPSWFEDTSPLAGGAQSAMRPSDFLPNRGLAGRKDQIGLIAGAIRQRRARDPRFMPGVPDSAEGLSLWSIEQEKKRRAEASAVQQRSPGGLVAFGAQVGGAFAKTWHDVPNLVAMGFVGGPAKTFVGTVARETVINGLFSVAYQPLIAANLGELGEEYGLGDAAASVAIDTTVGAAFGTGAEYAVRGVARGIGAARGGEVGAFGRALEREIRAAKWDEKRIAQVVTALQDPALGRPIILDALRELDDEQLVALSRAVHGEALTEDERAAITELESEAQLADGSPFVPGPAGEGEHDGRLAGALRAALNDRPPPPEPPPSSPGAAPDVPPPPGRAAAAGGGGRPESPGAASAFKARIRRAEAPGADDYNERSGATGPYQFVAETWVNLFRQRYPGDKRSFGEIAALRRDPALNEILIDDLIRENTGILERAGQAVNEGNLYLVHFLGPRSAAVLKADPATPIAQLVPGKFISQNPEVLGGGKSASQVVAWAHQQMGRSAASVPSGPGSFGAATEDPIVAQLRAEALELEALALGEIPLAGGGRIPPMHSGLRFRPNELLVDATAFQFKSGGDEFGVTDALKGVDLWNPMAAGQVIVWEAADGRRFVADGHQRSALARRIEAETGQEIQLDAIVMREADGVSAQDARIWAALTNIQQNRATPIDAAKVIRGGGEALLDIAGVSRTLPLVRIARPLARLSDDGFGMVWNERISPEYAAIVGELVDDPNAHAGILELLIKLEPPNAGQARSIVRQAIAAGFHKSEQVELFGAREMVSSLFLERAKVLERALARLRRMKLVHGTAAKEADTLEAVGSSIERAASEKEAQANAEAIEIIARVAFSRGPVADALNAAAGRLASGAKLETAVGEFVDAVRGIDLRTALEDAGGASGDRGAADGAGRDGGAAEAGEDLPAQPGDTSQPDLEADADQARLFDDPDGKAAQEQAASLEHDAKMELARADKTAPFAAEFERLSIPDFLRERIRDNAPEGYDVAEFLANYEASSRDALAMQREAALARGDLTSQAELQRIDEQLAKLDVKPPPGAPGAPPASAAPAAGTEPASAAGGAPGGREAAIVQLAAGVVDGKAAIAGQLGRSLDELLAMAEANQAELATFGRELEAATGAEFKDPGTKGATAKGRARIVQKAEEYRDIGEMKDLARGGFKVESYEQAQALVDAIAARYPFQDRGWQRLTGYADRKLVLRFPNGGVAEIQLIPTTIWDHKFGEGHRLYEQHRDRAAALRESPADRDVLDELEQLEEQMRAGYEALLAGTPFADGSGTPGNTLANSAGDSGTPLTLASENSVPLAEPGRQASPDQRAAVPSSNTATGASSSSNSLIDPSRDLYGGEAPESQAPEPAPVDPNRPPLLLDGGAAVDPAIAARGGQLATLGAAAPLRSADEQEGTMGLGLFDQVDQPVFAAPDGTPTTARDMLDELDRDEAAIAAIEGCL